jgi:hypothetical protein
MKPVRPAGEPMLKRYYVRAAIDAARDLWGQEGVDDIRSRMAEPERDEFLAERLPEWISIRAMIAWNFALWEGPARRSKILYFPWLRLMTDLSFGRVKKLFLSMASPEKVIRSANELWKENHTAGELEAEVDGKEGRFVLRQHPYTETPQGRAGIAEMLRYILELSRAKGVTETHSLVASGVLEIKVRWR